MIRLMILFGLAGCGMEAIFVGMTNGYRKQFVGTVCALWGLGYSLTPLVVYIVPETWTWYQRGSVYLLAIYAIEYAGNFLLQEEWGTHPSERNYRNGWHLNGLVSLEPIRIICWFVAGLGLEALAR